ncbi:MAG: ABC transporter substrate-binding protein [Janthinobacterium lividum]
MVSNSGLSRRNFLQLGAAAVAAPAVLAACSKSSGGAGGGGSSSEALKFWNMPWGQTTFNPLDQKITEAYAPATGLPKVTYQVIQWANFTQTFASAVASRTNPAVSSGGGTQVFQFEAQGGISYVDELYDTWKQNGLFDDFLPGLVDTLKLDKGYAAVPYNLDMRVIWYNKTLLEQAGAKVPTDWQSYLDAAAALKKNNIYGYGTGAGAGAYTGQHALVCWMINNGGGLFDENKQPNCVTPENMEAVDFVLEMVSKGYVDPASSTYTSANVQSQWKAKKFGLGIDTGGLPDNIGGDIAKELVVTSPLKSPSGKTGALYFPNNIMIYKNNTNIKGTEAFLTYYYQNMAPLWTQNTGIGLPPLKSISKTPEFQADKNKVKIVDEWQPISKTWAAPGGNAQFLNVTTVDATPAMNVFAQSILGGKTDSKTALTALQNAVKATMKS